MATVATKTKTKDPQPDLLGATQTLDEASPKAKGQQVAAAKVPPKGKAKGAQVAVFKPQTQQRGAEPAETAQMTSETAQMILLIRDMARDPSVDVDKMRALLDMQKELLADQRRMEFVRAKIAMRSKLPIVEKKGRIIVHDKVDKTKIIQNTPFARFEDLHEAVMPVLDAHGFDLTFMPAPSEKKGMVMIGELAHIGGHAVRGSFDMPLDTTGSKNDTQGAGSSSTYAKRYLMTALLNIQTRGEDDDGKSAGPGVRTLAPEQLQVIVDTAAAKGKSADAVLKTARTMLQSAGVVRELKRVDDVPEIIFDKLLAVLQQLPDLDRPPTRQR